MIRTGFRETWQALKARMASAQPAGAVLEPVNTATVLEEEFGRIHGTWIPAGTPDAGGDGQTGKAGMDSAQGGLATYYRNVHGLDGAGQTALCLSGGGIRSAAFCMGVLQGLARRKLLGQFHYLSTVSGGGYIGSWLTAWAHNNPRDSFGGLEDLVADRNPWAPERQPIRWLRSRQRYLNPNSSLMSPDTWAPVALVIRDLLLNWLVFLPLILAALLLPRVLEFGLVWWGYTNGGSFFGWLLTGSWGWLRGHEGAIPPPPLSTGWCDALGALLVGIAAVVATRKRLRGTRPGVAKRSVLMDRLLRRTVLRALDQVGTWRDGADRRNPGGVFARFLHRITPAMDKIRAWVETGPEDMDDTRFKWLVLCPLLLGAVVLTAFTAALALPGTDMDGVLLVEWCVGTALTLVVARAVAWRLPDKDEPHPWWNLGLECVALAVSGAVTGLAVWGLLKVRAQAGLTLQVGVRDLAAFGVPLLLAAYVLGQVVYAGLTSRSEYGRKDQEWLARASGHYLRVAAVWAAASSLVLFSQGLDEWIGVKVSAISGALTLTTAMSTFSVATSAVKASRAQVSVTKLATLACLVFLASGTVVLAHATATALAGLSGWHVALERGTDLASLPLASGAECERPGQWPAQEPGRPSQVDCGALASRAGWTALDAALLAAALAALAAGASFFVDVNLFSLHALYRNRLVRTFLGASNPGGDCARNRFSGFSERDNMDMRALWPAGRTRERLGPFPVVNMTVNLAPDVNLEWQQRQASSFVATPLHVGGDVVGYRRHGEASGNPLKLGTAMAISGAAFNANWGYHTSPVVRFVMMLFNVRLGWWLRNPGVVGRRRWNNWWLLFQETFGLLSPRDAHVYLSDGGHFENLGLYEMLRRRCRTIVVVDASQDFDMTLDDLGRSLRNAAIDMGVTVDFGDLDMVRRQTPPVPGVYCAVGSVRYPECAGTGAPPGRIIYVKPGFYKDSPADVRAYAASNARFPHDTTVNQWFTESQFESYRALGVHVLDAMFGPPRPMALAGLATRAERYIRDAAAGGAAAAPVRRTPRSPAPAAPGRPPRGRLP